MATGTLYLIPTTLGDTDADATLPARVIERIRGLDYFIAENPKSARAFLKLVAPQRVLRSLRIERFDHNSPPGLIDTLLEPVRAGTDTGLMSEAGCPAVADPGALLVRRAHHFRIRAVPLIGPSSILLSLIASGLESQRFAFHGYLPVKPPARDRAIREIEARSRKFGETEIFIETPYRNPQLFDALLAVCRPDTLLCVATQLTLPTETVRTSRVADWATEKPELKDRPSVFLILAER